VDQSLYLPYRKVRDKSIVVLSGEAADELFGGYPQFDPRAMQTGTFPWLITARINPLGMLHPDLLAALDHDRYVRDRYADAVAEAPVLDGEGELERQMRLCTYLHLTRLLPVFLDRGDRISMAAQVEARLPYCDHRLVEYVFNVPWSMRRPGEREKHLLREACRDLLPAAVLNRKKVGGYPSTLDSRYVAELQRQVTDLLATGSAALDFYDREQVVAATKAGPEALDWRQRAGMERLLDIAAWVELRRPTFKFSR
jgi:asparagine synthase (glutamine-hydrolysing)